MKTIPFDWFIDTVPQVIERVQQAERRGEERGEIIGEERGEAKGELQALRQVALDIVEDRFPDLIDFARSEVITATQPQSLRKFILDLNKTSDAIKVLQMLKQVGQ